MPKQVKIIHIVITVMAWGILIYSLIHLLITYQSLAEKIGVHFGGNGEFDVIDNKRYIAYPYIVSLIFLVLGELFAFLTWKIKMGLKISEIGEKKMRSAFVMLLDLMKVCSSFFFAGVWADCVMRQRPLNTNIPVTILWILFIAWIVFAVYIIIVKIRDSKTMT